MNEGAEQASAHRVRRREGLRSTPPASTAAFELLSAFGLLAALVHVGQPFGEIDSELARVAHRAAPSVGLGLARTITHVGDASVALVVLAVAALAMSWRARVFDAVTLVVSMALAQGIVQSTKALVDQPRPTLGAFVEADGFSFPSGHAATSAAVYALLGFLLAGRSQGLARGAVACFGVSIALAVGVSRVYLGAHFPTDVIGGWLAGAAAAVAAWQLAAALERDGFGRRQVSGSYDGEDPHYPAGERGRRNTRGP